MPTERQGPPKPAPVWPPKPEPDPQHEPDAPSPERTPFEHEAEVNYQDGPKIKPPGTGTFV